MQPEGSQTKEELIQVFPERTFQSVWGFGAALTNSAAYVISKSPQRGEILQKLFAQPPAGNAISALRLVMGGSDFQAVDPYTYNDLQDPNWQDLEMNQFSIGKDFEYVIPVLKEIKSINPGIKIVATPWSAPAWMKSNKHLFGGSFNTDSAIMAAYAKYFLLFIQKYAEQGIHIDAVTIQNEPELESNEYPTMKLEWYQELNFIAYHLGPMFESNGISTEIWIWDHNWDMSWYPDLILKEDKASKYVKGSAFHCYGGVPADMDMVHNNHPDKDIFATECSGGTWSTDFASNLYWNLYNLFIGQLRHWSRSVMFWNLALDPNHGPQVGVNGGCNGCRGVVTVDSNSYNLEVEYYMLGHFTRFVQPGSVRVDSTPVDNDKTLHNVAFTGPNGQTTVVVGNGWEGGWKHITIQIGNSFYNYPHDLRHAEVLTFKFNC